MNAKERAIARMKVGPDAAYWAAREAGIPPEPSPRREAPLRPTPVPTPARRPLGVGGQVKAMVGWLGRSCGACAALSRELDDAGPDAVSRDLDGYAKRLVANARALGYPAWDGAARALLRRAIRLARRELSGGSG